MRTRLAFALGSWQLVALEAALREADRGEPAADDVLVLYETTGVGEALAGAMRGIAAGAGRWRTVVEAFDLGVGWPKRLSQRHALALQRRLRERVGDRDVAELWVCRLDRRLERLFAETWPDARLVVYEDGVLSYLPVDAAPPAMQVGWARAVRRTLRRLVAWRRGGAATPLVERLGPRRQGIDIRHSDRIVAAWMLLGDVFAPPDWLRGVAWQAVPATTLRQTVAALAALPAVAAFAGAAAAAPAKAGGGAARPCVLVLGQALSRFHALPRNVELDLYAGAVETILARGYDVLWKEHPRALHPFFAELAATAPGRVRELQLPHALPVELVADRLDVAAVAGGMTTALFYLPRVAGIAAFSFADRFVPHLRRGWARQNDLFVERLAPLDDLPSRRER